MKMLEMEKVEKHKGCRASLTLLKDLEDDMRSSGLQKESLGLPVLERSCGSFLFI